MVMRGRAADVDQTRIDHEAKVEPVELKGLRPEELEAFVGSMGLEAYRGRQLVAWIYRRGVTDFGEMTDLSRATRERLAGRAHILSLRRVAEDRSEDGGTTKYLLELPDGQRIESVLIYEGRRRTLCVSSQAGCALDCKFCATAQMGFRRNLSAGEILDQLISVRRDLVGDGDDVTNVVLMGMGEPLHNYENVIRAI
ncbi:MAG: 23S rRNA (adenine(2503)-C(2))-methyltransferase RlmN, partial [Candidatus Latescibacteria bacterium]|nr:23S rRNA (adenine(2503)-C(2))-methyltransferase RlmN [Candidatus Latescibacterota bacterium]